MTPSGIEPATFRFVAQNLNHCATAVPENRYTSVKSTNYIERCIIITQPLHIMTQGILVTEESSYTNKLVISSQRNYLLGVNRSISIALQDPVK
jgi:hypothetical protein